MKKLYIMFTLILSSFFLFNYNVKAETIELVIPEDITNLITDDFLSFRELVITYANENNKNYVIFYNIDLSLPNHYIVYFVDKSTNFGLAYYNDFEFSGSYFNSNYKQCDLHYFENGEMILYSRSSSFSYNFNLSNFINYIPLDFSGQIDFHPYGFDWSLKYLDSSVTYVKGLDNSYVTVYDLYSKHGISSDLHKEEKEVLSNFYSLIFEKIDLLANSILSNYIYLTIIVIFILIFLIELIRRYLL